MATQQDDIKRILAYSTISQLGYMIMAIGVAAPGAAIFHLFTHAFFKALLFLGAGAVIHMLHHEQDIWRMGGLRKSMRVTFATFAIGTLALTGCPFFAGFFSKDAILLAAYQGRPGTFLFWIGLAVAFLTAFYMTRLVVVAFFGKPRTEAAGHGHDGPLRMIAPLMILALFSIIAGWGFIANRALGHELAHAVHALHDGPGSLLVPTLAILAFLTGTGAAWVLYAGREKDPIRIPLFRQKFYIDELYAALIAATQDFFAGIAAFIDRWIIDGVLVRGLSGAAWGLGFALRFFQYGNLQGYAFLFGVGVIVLIYLMVLR